jgi:hypothetical protein
MEDEVADEVGADEVVQVGAVAVAAQSSEVPDVVSTRLPLSNSHDDESQTWMVESQQTERFPTWYRSASVKFALSLPRLNA